MIVFWICALALVAVALLFILPPLLGTRRRNARRSGDAVAQDHHLALYRARLEALEEQHRIGTLGADDLTQARNELARDLLAESGSAAWPAAGVDAGDASRRASARPWLAITVGVGVPLLSIALYQQLGAPGAVEPLPAPATGAAQPPVEDMVARLAERMRSEPDNSDGWLLLGRSYMALNRYAEASAAFAAAHALLGDSPALLADLAEAHALNNGQNFLGPANAYLEQALALDPTYPKALWLGAFAAMQRGEAALAVSRWQSLLDRQPGDSEAAAVLRGLIADAGAAPEPAGEAPPPAAGAPGLTVNVTVADHLLADLDGSEALFVFARAAEGPPMPLAVSRMRVSDLPLTVVLDDSMAMAPGLKLSSFDSVVVGARISRSGRPTASSGDLQGFSEALPVDGTTSVSIAITERVP
jgi:cytochrome c-type biogenesis protein CcmH